MEILSGLTNELFETIHPNLDSNFKSTIFSLLEMESYEDMDQFLTNILGCPPLEESENTILDIDQKIVTNTVDEVLEYDDSGEFVEDENKDHSKKLSLSETRYKYDEALTEGSELSVESDENTGWISASPDEEDVTRKIYGEKLPDRHDKAKIQREKKITTTSKIIDSIDSKEFLLDQYRGHCQLCNTKLYLGPNTQPYFNTFRMVELKEAHEWADMEFNVICLCPNCHALMRHHPTRDLTNISEVANKILKGEVASEEVEERRGDYYIIDVVVAGKNQQMYFTQNHMQKISAYIDKTNDETSEI